MDRKGIILIKLFSDKFSYKWKRDNWSFFFFLEKSIVKKYAGNIRDLSTTSSDKKIFKRYFIIFSEKNLALSFLFD